MRFTCVYPLAVIAAMAVRERRDNRCRARTYAKPIPPPGPQLSSYTGGAIEIGSLMLVMTAVTRISPKPICSVMFAFLMRASYFKR